MRLATSFLACLSSAWLLAAHPSPAPDSFPRALPGSWFHPEDHPLHALFRRQSSPNASFAPVGSTQWSARFPPGKADSSKMPQAWKDALAAAVQSGKIPANIPVSKQASSGANPTYAGFAHPEQPPVCSGTYQCRLPGQIWDAPNGSIGISFDDGPLPPSDGLYAFLQQNNIPSTHFYIGTNILQYPNEFKLAFDTLHSDIAVHTWTHPYMTTFSNDDVVAELGYTLQLIYNSTGGRLARYWRPPYGDTDARVSAIASSVFGLTTVLWNQDTNDWSLGESGGTNAGAIAANFQKWLSGSKSPGLIVLEHELSNGSVNAFKAAYPVIKANNWTVNSVAQLQGLGSYQNAQDSSSPVLTVSAITAGGNGATELASATAALASASSASAASVSPGNANSKASSSAPSPSSSVVGASNNNSNAALRLAVGDAPWMLFFASIASLLAIV
ncbi:hypothetical protein OF83DRAFT_1167517 [Amylostereum chailletii]|nr:hypothetical protein OF83DRAFT_1167517 [Amylostereum chailletii]